MKDHEAIEVDLPSLFHAADRSSLAAQRRYLRLTTAQLLFLAAAAASSIATWRSGQIDYAALIGAVAFVIAGVFRVQNQLTNPGKTWYQGRAAAESVKTLSWRYAVGGDPFSTSLSETEADTTLVERFRDVLQDLDSLAIVDTGEGEEITEWMQSIRRAPLAIRRGTYGQGRIADARAWYASKAQWNSRRARLWGTAMLLFESFGVLQALLKATGVVDVDILGFIATVIAGIAAWIQTKDYQTLSNAYSITARELAAIHALVRHQESEEEWASFVDSAEESISREHTLWRASRS